MHDGALRISVVLNVIPNQTIFFILGPNGRILSIVSLWKSSWLEIINYILNVTILCNWTFKFITDFIYNFQKQLSAVATVVDEAMIIEKCLIQSEKHGNLITKNSRRSWYCSTFRNLVISLKKKNITIFSKSEWGLWTRGVEPPIYF